MLSVPSAAIHIPFFSSRFFSTLYYLALVCDDTLIQERLQLRPSWRESGSSDVIKRMIRFNRLLKEHAATMQPPMALYDTSNQSIRETAEAVAPMDT